MQYILIDQGILYQIILEHHYFFDLDGALFPFYFFIPFVFYKLGTFFPSSFLSSL